MLKPLKNNVLIQFLDETQGPKGKFVERGSKFLIIPALDSNQHGVPRWAKVVAVGPEADGVAVGDFALVEPMQWSFRTEPMEEFGNAPIWRTFDHNILMVTDDESLTYQF
jgi:co-chaperonin GroES (HSP10)